ncbi:hypothetical protein GOARA_011_00620 [Gordonia araii NBRC 100433]|uniref:Acyl-ACP thioesterase n=1 Tax=Gordonia araii NBRC 100433 TaxID=1073574 RepID=G7GXX1_9ACTN|nr:acyl-ACP thioesterase domain-containing protein [Gordonia araii]GAB08446.1 hypothetical protein GOARA_011_00620 [Gordonia araii NBRC 100433]
MRPEPTAPVFADCPVEQEPYTATYRVRGSDIDGRMRVRLDGIARYLQNIGEDMIEDSGFFDSDPFWILRRTVIEVREPLSWPGDARVERWCSATSSRWVSMRQRVTGLPEASPFNPGDRPAGLVETESFCIKINDQGLPSRISDEALEALSRGVDEQRLRWRAMNPAEPGEGTVEGPGFRLRATDLDQFKHVNNTVYWQVAEEVLATRPELLEAPYRAVIEFLRPVPPDTQVRVLRTDVDDGFDLWLLLPDDAVATTIGLRRI